MSLSDLLPFIILYIAYRRTQSVTRAIGWTILVLALLIVLGGVAVFGLSFGDGH